MNRTSAPPDFANSFVLFLPILIVNLRELHARAALGEEREPAPVVDRALRALVDVAALDREVEAVLAALRGSGRVDPDAHVGEALTGRLIELEHRLAAGYRVGDRRRYDQRRDHAGSGARATTTRVRLRTFISTPFVHA